MGSFNFTVTMLIYRIFISANILNSVFSASLDNLGLNDDNEEVALEDLSDFDLHSSDRIQLEKMTRGSDCQYINLVNIKDNHGCTSGSKFVVKPMKHMRKQYLILNGQILLVFAKKSKKFTECQSYQDITSIVECKTVKGLNSIDLQSDSSLDSSVAPSSDLKSNGILLTGGVRVNQTDPLSPETLRSVEVYVPSSNLSYSCPPLPEERFGHVQERTQYCEGFLDAFLDASCYTFGAGSWQRSTSSAMSMMATSFHSSAGFVLLGALGDLDLEQGTASMQALLVEGEDSPRTLFSLIAPAISSCSITDYGTDSVIVIGGSLSEGSKESGQYGDIQVNTTVVRYNLAGFVEFLPSTNQPRVASACSSYKDGGETILLTAGGIPDTASTCPECPQSGLSSVEILRVGEAAWEVTTALPVPLIFSSAININNVLYLLGGVSNSDFDESQDIYEWLPATREWIVTAKMLSKRSAFGISAIDIEAGMLEHCVSGNRGTDMLEGQTGAPLNQTTIDNVLSLYLGK